MPLQIRRGTEAERTAQTVPFAAGELVYATDSQKLYIGNGSTVGGIILTGFGPTDAKNAAAAVFTGGTNTGITFSYDTNNQVMNSTVSFPSSLTNNLSLNTHNITGTGNINITGTITATAFSGNIGGNLASDIVLNSHNITGTGSISITGNVTATSFFGNLNGGLAADLVMNSHNITGTGNVNTSGTITGSILNGNLSGGLAANLALNSHDITGIGNINTTGNIIVSGTFNAQAGLGADLRLNNHDISGTGNIIHTGNIVNTGNISSNGTISTTSGGNITASGYITAVGNISTGDGTVSSAAVVAAGNISSTGGTISTSSLTIGTDGSIVSSVRVSGFDNDVFIGTKTTPNTLNITSAKKFLTMTGVVGGGGGIPNINTFISRGTLASPTAVQPGDPLMVHSAAGWDGTSYVSEGSYGLIVDPEETVSTNKVLSLYFVRLADRSNINRIMQFTAQGIFTAPVILASSYAGSVNYPGGANWTTLSPQPGMIIYDSNSNHFLGYNGTTWKQLDN